MFPAEFFKKRTEMCLHLKICRTFKMWYKFQKPTQTHFQHLRKIIVQRITLSSLLTYIASVIFVL